MSWYIRRRIIRMVCQTRHSNFISFLHPHQTIQHRLKLSLMMRSDSGDPNVRRIGLRKLKRNGMRSICTRSIRQKPREERMRARARHCRVSCRTASEAHASLPRAVACVPCCQAMKCPTGHTQLGDVHIWSGRPKWNDRFQAIAAKHAGDIGVAFCGQQQNTTLTQPNAASRPSRTFLRCTNRSLAYLSPFKPIMSSYPLLLLSSLPPSQAIP